MKIEQLEISADQVMSDKHRAGAIKALTYSLKIDGAEAMATKIVNDIVACAVYECSIGMTKSWNEAVRKQ